MNIDQKVCKTPPMKFLKRDQVISTNGFAIETPGL